MPTAAFATLGCKVNQYETQRILDDFEERGFTITEFNVPADVYVINTCSVTQAAERKSRSMVRRLARQNPDAVVVMTGCYGEMAQIKGETVEEATLLVPNHQKLDTLKHVLSAYPRLERELSERIASERAIPAARRTRATIKVQDGCNVFCSFCSIPYTRKVMLSRPMEELIAEAEKRVSQGYRELVVTGVLVGAYGQENLDLADCLLELAQVPGIQRVRLSSIEPTQVTDRLLDAFAREPKLCRHLHIPLQSGDTGVLRAMNRPYDREFYLDRCREAYRRIPDLAITGDIMVGFPGEDAAAFENTLDVVRTVGFARAHLFRYSPRPNTPAAEFPNQISDQEKEARSKALNAACRETQQQFIQRFIGRTLEVLVEGKEGPNADSESISPSEERQQPQTGNDHHERVENEHEQAPNVGGLLGGYTSNYIRVQFTGGSHLVGTIAGVRLVELSNSGALGEVGGAHFGPYEAPPDADFIPLASFAGSVT